MEYSAILLTCIKRYRSWKPISTLLESGRFTQVLLYREPVLLMTPVTFLYLIVYMMYIENTRWVSFDIKFTRQGFENACWHREACRAIQNAFSKPSLVNLISKDANLVFYLSVYPFLNTFQTSDYDVIFDFCVDLASLATSFKKCNVIMTW